MCCWSMTRSKTTRRPAAPRNGRSSGNGGSRCRSVLCPLDNRLNKQVRIRRLTPWLARREIRFKANSPGARLLVEQLRDFPNADHDDGPDALEIALRVVCEQLALAL